MKSCQQNAINQHLDSVPAPSFDELIELAKVDGAILRDIEVLEGGATIARALCVVVVRRHHGVWVKVFSLFGGALHDYLPICARSHDVARR